MKIRGSFLLFIQLKMNAMVKQKKFKNESL